MYYLITLTSVLNFPFFETWCTKQKTKIWPEQTNPLYRIFLGVFAFGLKSSLMNLILFTGESRQFFWGSLRAKVQCHLVVGILCVCLL